MFLSQIVLMAQARAGKKNNESWKKDKFHQINNEAKKINTHYKKNMRGDGRGRTDPPTGPANSWPSTSVSSSAPCTGRRPTRLRLWPWVGLTPSLRAVCRRMGAASEHAIQTAHGSRRLTCTGIPWSACRVHMWTQPGLWRALSYSQIVPAKRMLV